MMPVGVIAAVVMSVAVSAAPARKSFEFIGFSHNEQINAWRQIVSQPQHGGFTDHYSVIRVYETEGQHLLAVYREHGVRRTDSHGNFVFTSEAAQLRDNPDYAHAHAHSEWNHVAKQARFHASRLDFHDTTVRLDTDNDAKLRDVWPEKKTIMVDAEPGSPVGYAPVARLVDGSLLPLGHFRVEPAKAQSQVHAEVQVFYSRTGRNIAVLNKFEVEGEYNDGLSQMVMVKALDPIATIGLGTLGLLQDDAQTARRIFLEMHPGAKKMWDEQLGGFF